MTPSTMGVESPKDSIPHTGILVKVPLVYVRRTKGLCRYQEEVQPPTIGVLYVSQTVLGKPVPQRIVVTIERGVENATD